MFFESLMDGFGGPEAGGHGWSATQARRGPGAPASPCPPRPPRPRSRESPACRPGHYAGALLGGGGRGPKENEVITCSQEDGGRNGLTATPSHPSLRPRPASLAAVPCSLLPLQLPFVYPISGLQKTSKGSRRPSLRGGREGHGVARPRVRLERLWRGCGREGGGGGKLVGRSQNVSTTNRPTSAGIGLGLQ